MICKLYFISFPKESRLKNCLVLHGDMSQAVMMAIQRVLIAESSYCGLTGLRIGAVEYPFPAPYDCQPTVLQIFSQNGEDPMTYKTGQEWLDIAGEEPAPEMPDDEVGAIARFTEYLGNYVTPGGENDPSGERAQAIRELGSLPFNESFSVWELIKDRPGLLVLKGGRGKATLETSPEEIAQGKSVGAMATSLARIVTRAMKDLRLPQGYIVTEKVDQERWVLKRGKTLS